VVLERQKPARNQDTCVERLMLVSCATGNTTGVAVQYHATVLQWGTVAEACKEYEGFYGREYLARSWCILGRSR